MKYMSFFFFKQKTAYEMRISDWSSDVCSSDLGCGEAGDRPAPKSPNNPERWYFCEAHAAEYNRGWDYFAGLSAEEAAAREQAERNDASAYQQTSHYAWGGPGDGTRDRTSTRLNSSH